MRGKPSSNGFSKAKASMARQRLTIIRLSGALSLANHCLLYEHVMKDSFVKSRWGREEHLRVKGEPIDVDA